MLLRLKDLFKDSATYGVSSMLSQIIGFLLLPLYTQFLNPTDYGIVAMMGYIGIFFVPLAAMGLGNAVFRRFNAYTEQDQQNKVLSTALITILVASALLFLILLTFKEWLAFVLIDDSEKTDLVLICLITGVFMSINSLLTVVLRAKRKVATIAVVRLVQLLFTILITIYLVVFLNWGAKGVITGTLVGTASGAIMLVLITIPKVKLQFSIQELRQLYSYGLPFLPHRLMGLGTGFVTQFFIKNYIGLEETGLYSIALRFAIPLSFVVGAVQSAWVPLKFQIHREERAPKPVFTKIISFYLVLISFILITLLTCGPELIRLFTPINYHQAVYYFPFVLLIFFSRGLYYIISTGFEFTDNTRPLPIISAIGFIVLIVLGWFLILRIGVYGIIAAVVVSWVVRAVLIRLVAITRYRIALNLQIVIGSCVVVTLFAVIIHYSQMFSFGWRLAVEVVMFMLTFIYCCYSLHDSLKTFDLQKFPLLKRFYKGLDNVRIWLP